MFIGGLAGDLTRCMRDCPAALLLHEVWLIPLGAGVAQGGKGGGSGQRRGAGREGGWQGGALQLHALRAVQGEPGDSGAGLSCTPTASCCIPAPGLACLASRAQQGSPATLLGFGQSPRKEAMRQAA